MSRFDAACCSFCGKDREETKLLVSGPTVYICTECVLEAAVANRKADPNFLRKLPRPGKKVS
jgi:ATP-dependent protease Clp ATPase subunit